MAAGLAGMLFALSPSGGRTEDVGWYAWIIGVTLGILGMFLVQSAMNAGRLVAAQPGLTLTDPIVSILWGVLVFGEQVRTGWFLALTVVGGLLMVSAVFVLARSPLLSSESSGER